MEHPLGLFAQGIAAALGELIGQLHQQILGTALFHISGHRAQEHAVAAKVIDLQSGTLQQLKVGEECSLFPPPTAPPPAAPAAAGPEHLHSLPPASRKAGARGRHAYQ